MNEEPSEVRKPDYDLEACLQNNPQPFIIDDILTVLAEVPGANDELDWYWVVQFKPEFSPAPFALIYGGCDYTGWDCQSFAHSEFAFTAQDAADYAPQNEEYSQRRIRHFLTKQLSGEQPFGTYDGETLNR